MATVAVVAAALVGCGSGEDLGGEPMAADLAVIVPATAEGMGEVTSVRFELERSGAPVYIDQFGELQVDEVRGRVRVPDAADALLVVTVSGDLSTKLGAVAIDGDVWLSNPVTGDFEPLPGSYDLDPTLFFDPQGGWRPLIEGLTDVTLVGMDDRDGQRYHLRGTAPAERIESVTARLVRDQEVVMDLWIHPVTGLVTAAEFDTELDGAISSWELRLTDYGAEFEIVPPAVDG